MGDRGGAEEAAAGATAKRPQGGNGRDGREILRTREIVRTGNRTGIRGEVGETASEDPEQRRGHRNVTGTVDRGGSAQRVSDIDFRIRETGIRTAYNANVLSDRTVVHRRPDHQHLRTIRKGEPAVRTIRRIPVRGGRPPSPPTGPTPGDSSH